MTSKPDDPDPRDQALARLLRRALQDEAPPAALRARVLALDPAAAAAPGMARAADARSVRALAATAATAAGEAARRLRSVVAQVLQAPAGAALPLAPAAGLRGGAGARQWLYRAEDCEIDLRVLPGVGERWRVLGQLFGELAAQGVVLEGPGGPRRAATGPMREFGFDDLAAGRYRLAVQGAEVEVVVPQVEVGDAGG